MRTSFIEINEIFKTLPIGYYLGRKINHILSETSVGSCYIPDEDKIIISYPTIAEMIGRIDEKFAMSKETIIRSILYHEISHVILTPANMKSYASTNEEADAINIVEDERIETTLANYYMDVNFKKNIILANNWHGEEGTTLFEKFYHLVRFRQGEPEWLNRLEQVLEVGENVISTSAEYSTYFYDNKGNSVSVPGYADYVYEIIKFYRDFMTTQQEQQNNQSNDNDDNTNDNDNNDNNDTNGSNDDSQQDNNENQMKHNMSNSNQSNDNDEENNNDDDTSDANNNDNSDEDNNSTDTKNNNSSSNNDTNNENEDTNDKNDNGNDIEEAEKEIEELLQQIDNNTSKQAGNTEVIKNFINTTVNKYYDVALEDRLSNILTNIMKRRANNGAAISSYSGHMNIRAVGTRDDYRWWSTGNRNGHLKTTTKVHFNLFIDNSGSFSDNDDATNTLIKALDRLSRKFTDFTFDIITINTSIREWNGHNQIFRSYGGTELSNDIKDVIKKHTKSNARNINIVLFDGEAHSGCRVENEPFRHFNNIDTFIISDNDNRRYIDPVITKAKVTYCRNYCSEFVNTVCTQLEKTL